MSVENPYFTAFEEGKFEPGALRVKVVETRRVVNNDLQAKLNKKWDNHSGTKRPDDDRPSRYRYEGYDTERGVLSLKVSPTISYEDYITWSQELTDQYGLESAPLAIAATGIIITSDGRVILTIRDQADYKKGGLSGSGGFITIKDDAGEDKIPDIVGALKRETKEETGIEPDELDSTLIGIYYNPVSGSVNLGFVSTTSLTSEVVLERPHDTENELMTVKLDPDIIQNLVLTRTNAFTTETLALLISLLPAQRVGETEAILKLRGVSYVEALSREAKVMRLLERRDITDKGDYLSS